MQIEKRIMAVWRLPPQSEGRKITLRMKLSPGGYTSEVRVENSSGDEKFDASASRRCDAVAISAGAAIARDASARETRQAAAEKDSR
jgi:TonB family protein